MQESNKMPAAANCMSIKRKIVNIIIILRFANDIKKMIAIITTFH